VAHVAPNARARVPNFASGFSKNERAPFPAFVFSFAFETRVAPVADARSRTTNTQGQIESVTESKRSRSAEPVAGAGTSIHSEIERARADARDDALVIRSARSRRICARDDFDDRRVSAAFDLDSNSPDLFFHSRFDRRRCHDTFRETRASLRHPVMRGDRGVASKVDGRRCQRRRRRRRRRRSQALFACEGGDVFFLSIETRHSTRDASRDRPVGPPVVPRVSVVTEWALAAGAGRSGGVARGGCFAIGTMALFGARAVAFR